MSLLKRELSIKERWILLGILSGIQPFLLYTLHPLFGGAVSTTGFFIPVLATFLLGLRAGFFFGILNGIYVSLIFSRLEVNVPVKEGLPRFGLFLAVTLLLCFGSARLRLYLKLRRSAETALKDQEGQYRMIFENSAEGIVCLDRSGVVLDANPQVEEHLGYSSSELVGRRFDEIGVLSQESARKIRSTIGNSDFKGNLDLAVDGRSRQGKAIILDINISFLEQSDNPTRYIGMLKNTTERRNMEAQLQRAKRMEAIGRLAGGVAHDMNNILNAIMGSAFALSHEISQYRRRFEDLENITHACDRGAELTRNLLGFARKNEVEIEAFSLNSVVKSVLALLTRTAPKDILFINELEERLPLIDGDRGQMENAVMNLGLNAIHAMEDGGEITFTTRSGPVGVTLAISDTGPGIDDSIRDHVFEPFFTTKPEGEGTGLGLSMVYGLVKSLNGEIAVESAPGKGTAMILTFPRSKSDEDVVASSLPPKTLTGKNSLSGRTVLVVDDEPIVLRASMRMLGTLGCEVISANSGSEAISLFEANQGSISLVILDLVMPKMDGVAVLRALRSLDSETPVLLVSGYTSDNEKLRRLDREVSHFGILSKPYLSHELVNAASKLLHPGPNVSRETAPG